MTEFILFAQEKKKESTVKVVHKKHMNLKMLSTHPVENYICITDCTKHSYESQDRELLIG